MWQGEVFERFREVFPGRGKTGIHGESRNPRYEVLREVYGSCLEIEAQVFQEEDGPGGINKSIQLGLILEHVMYELNSPFVLVRGVLGVNPSKHFPEVMGSFHLREPPGEASEVVMQNFRGIQAFEPRDILSLDHVGSEATGLEDIRDFLGKLPPQRAQAAAEFQVRAPLKEAGLTKADIRRLSAELGLPTEDKPQMACLSSRIPYGELVTPEKLRMIEAAENVLKDSGFYDVRVRHHELKSEIRNPKSEPCALARIEVGAAELPRLLENGLSVRVAEALKGIGYAHVTVDLQGYRRGSLNEVSPQRITRSAVVGEVKREA